MPTIEQLEEQIKDLRSQKKRRTQSHLGAAIQEFRELRGLNQSQLAAAAGIPASLVTKFETKPAPNPTLNTLKAVASGLNISVQSILSRMDAIANDKNLS